MTVETMILLGVGLYLLIMVAVGFYASRESHSLSDFVVAGRNLPLWLCSVTVFATWFGSGTMMGVATSAYDGDMLLMVGEPFGSGLALLLSGLFFARILRRTRRFTWPEFFQARYGKLAGVFGALADALSHVIWMGAVLFTFGVLLESLTGTPMSVGIYVGLAVIVIYTMVGGMWAVAMTDFIQMIIFVSGLFILLFVVLGEAGGWSAISAQLPDGAFRLIPVEHTAQNWVDWVHVWMALGVAAIASSSIIQRTLSARTEGVAQNSFYIAAIVYVTIGLIPLMLGFSARVLLPNMEDPNAALTELALTYLHPVLVAVFIGAIISAIMSTSDSILLGVASVISTNLLPVVVKNPSEELRFKVVRYSIPVIGLVASYFALNADRAVAVIIDSAAVLLAGIIVPFILCFWWEKANRSGALAGLVFGIGTWIVAGEMDSTFPPDLIGFCVSFVAMVSVTLLTQKVDPPRPLTDIDGESIELKDRFGNLPVKGQRV
jgi:SSS family solute:Na+ symporter